MKIKVLTVTEWEGINKVKATEQVDIMQVDTIEVCKDEIIQNAIMKYMDSVDEYSILDKYNRLREVIYDGADIRLFDREYYPVKIDDNTYQYHCYDDRTEDDNNTFTLPILIFKVEE